MLRWSWGLAALVAVTALLAVSTGRSGAQTVVVTPAPVVRYYAPPPVVVTPAPVTVTTYRYGVLPRRRVVVQTYSYAAPAPVAVQTYAYPAPVAVQTYAYAAPAPAPVVVVRPRRVVRYYGYGPVYYYP
jgi:hypothetical protein